MASVCKLYSYFILFVQVKCEQLENERNVLRQRCKAECGEKMGFKTKLKVVFYTSFLSFLGMACYQVLKGQSHEKFCELGIWGLSLGQK
jgi:isocitrate dehydrogenase kinase/phosphatase